MFHTSFKPLDWNFLDSHKDSCYIKVIVNLVDDKVLGIHFLGPNAGNIIQGFSVAMKLGLTSKVLFDTVGIHPVSAENIVKLKKTKRSHPNARLTGC